MCGADFVAGGPSCLVLGDNIFFGHGDFNCAFLERGQTNFQVMGRGYAWLDTGTPDSLLEAAEFVATLERRQGMKIACPEEIASYRGFIDATGLEACITRHGKSAYAGYLKGLLADR